MNFKDNIPKIKIGIVAVSRDCFPENLSVTRRESIVSVFPTPVGMTTVAISEETVQCASTA